MFNEFLDTYFREIIDVPTASGFETEGQKVFRRYAGEYTTDIQTDTLGNVIVHFPNEGKSKLMIIAHMDEVGFMVKYIDDSGMLYIVPIGGIDTMLLAGARLCVHHDGNSFLGIVGRKPIHLLSEQERRGFSMEDLWLDLGFTSKTHALKSVAIGDVVTYETDIRQISDDYVVTHSADNKVGGLIMLGVMQQLQEITVTYDLYFVSSVQEEIGLRGSMPAASLLEPDIALVIDATHATDYPMINPKLYGEMKLGGGAAFCISPDTHREITSELENIATELSVPFQKEAHANASGTESRAIQIVRRGVRTGIISFPVRYMHAPSELFSISDVKSCIRVITEFCKQ